MAWVVGEQAAAIGTTRFLLLPIAASLIGEESFGVFIMAMSVVAILGATPSMGLSTGILRHLVEYPEAQQPRFCQTAVRLCHKAMLIILAAGLLGIAVAGAARLAPVEILGCLVSLVVSLYAENQFGVMLTDLRVKREFKVRTFWTVYRAAWVFAIGLVGAYLGGTVGLAAGFATGNMIGYVTLRYQRREWLRQPYDPEMGRVLKRIWFHMTLAGILALSGQYLNRIILGIYYSFSDVAHLFAATSITAMFLVLLGCFNYLLLSMLARYKSFSELTKTVKIQWLTVLIVSMVGLPTAVMAIGPVVLRIMYPEFSDEAIDLLRIVVWMMPFAVVADMVRPFVVKFSPTKVIPIVNGLALSGFLIPSLVLIPRFGCYGAAWSFVLGRAIHATSFVVVPWAVARRASAQDAE